LKKELGRDVSSLALQSSTPGVLYGDLLIMGMRLGEGPAPVAPGHIRAFNVRTGKLAWRFHTIPQPGEFGYDTWPPNAYQYTGAANVWTGFALDEKRGIVFCPTGSAAFDFWGGNRIGQNLFANCLIALDAKTGQRIWHQQIVRHDSVGPRSARAAESSHRHAPWQTHRRRRAGDEVRSRLRLPSRDRRAALPDSRSPGADVRSPGRIRLADAADSDEARAVLAPAVHLRRHHRHLARIASAGARTFHKIRPHTPYLPPSREGSIVFPGFDGGAEWGGAATDPDGVLYVNGNEMPWVLTMVETKRKGAEPLASGEAIFTQICAACHGVDRQGNKAQNVPSLVGVEQRLKKPDVLALLKTGKGVMPSFDFLTENQRQLVVDYLLGTAPATPVNDAGRKEELGGVDVLGTIPYTMTGYHRWLDTNGYPAIKPPWGTLNAIDLNTGEYRWRVTLGEWPELTAKGVPPTGTENYGGPVVTAGGLVFIAASRDEHLRAFDRKTGRELWKAKLPAAGYATPSTYSVNGRQYVVIACGGGKIGTRSGDAYVAFALPK
jgi:quinoprotein glucose dehydrogenase